MDILYTDKLLLLLFHVSLLLGFLVGISGRPNSSLVSASLQASVSHLLSRGKETP